MSRVGFEVWHTDSGGNTTNRAADVLSFDVVQTVTTPKQSSSQTFNVEFANPGRKNSEVFTYSDQLHIRAWSDDRASGTLIVGKIQSLNKDFNDKGRTIKVRGQDYSEVMLHNLVNEVYDVSGIDIDGNASNDNDFNAGNVVKHAITNFARTDEISWNTDNIVSGGDLAPMENSEFPVNERPFERWIIHNKKLYEVLHELTSSKMTGGVEFQFFIEATGTPGAEIFNVYYEPKPNTIDGTIREAVHVNKASSKTKIDDRKNALIIYYGDDENGDPYYTTARNSTSISQIGWRWDFFNAGNILQQTVKNRIERGGGTWTNAEPVTEADINNAKRAAKIKGEKIVVNEGIPLETYDITVKGNNAYTCGNRLTIQLPSLDVPADKTYRLSQVSHKISPTIGWITVLKAETDVMET